MNDTVSEDVKLGDDKLREILAGCEGVTPGPWEAGHHWVFVPPEDAANNPSKALRDILRRVPEVELQPNAEHIARLDPQTVASIVTELLERRAYLAATKPPEEHETCALCGLPAPDGYVEFDADGEAMHPHCRAAATKPPLAGEVTPVYRVDWENAPRDGTRVLLLSKGTHPDYRVEQRLFWSKHYSIHDLGGCWSDGFVTMSDLDFIGWRFDASPPMPGRGEGFVLVPVEPTAEMREAARGALKDRGQEQVWGADAVAIYRAMLAASRPKEDTHAK
jgi:hypothetical protein